MKSSRFLQRGACVVGVLLAASLALAGKPAPPPSIIATTTDQNFLNNVVNKVSSQTTFNLAISVSGTGTHYRYKIGPAATTDPTNSPGTPAPIPEATRLTADISGQPDGNFWLCLQGLELDRKGVIKVASRSPKHRVLTGRSMCRHPRHRRSWIAEPGAGEVPLFWGPGSTPPSTSLSYDATGEAVTWQPVDGQTYTPGDLDGGTHKAVYVGSSTSTTDSVVVPGTTYYYAVFAFDGARNYSGSATDSATPTEPSGGGDYYWHPEQLVGSSTYSTWTWTTTVMLCSCTTRGTASSPAQPGLGPRNYPYRTQVFKIRMQLFLHSVVTVGAIASGVAGAGITMRSVSSCTPRPTVGGLPQK